MTVLLECNIYKVWSNLNITCILKCIHSIHSYIIAIQLIIPRNLMPYMISFVKKNLIYISDFTTLTGITLFVNIGYQSKSFS